ncbi:MAG: PRC-barrel domain-containing protein [Gloeobacteraceae cyanobacterium ES-bin-144]|nr:PRC-barrel domain-containing protein [Verrucomicrobiales bacterium]
MLKNTSSLYGTPLAASDGNIGSVSDFYFDDQSWNIRYLVVDTGNWLIGRQVLLTPHSVDGFGEKEETLLVHLTKKQIEDSPPIDSHLPVTRQHERDYHQYFNWPTYWDTPNYLGSIGIPNPTPQALESYMSRGNQKGDDTHLRSTTLVTGYDIEASDGYLGSITGFMIDHKSWEIHKIVVGAGHWYSSKEILISPKDVISVNYEDSSVLVKFSLAEIAQAFEDVMAKTEDLSVGGAAVAFHE